MAIISTGFCYLSSDDSLFLKEAVETNKAEWPSCSLPHSVFHNREWTNIFDLKIWRQCIAFFQKCNKQKMKEKKVGHYSLGCQLDSIPKTKK